MDIFIMLLVSFFMASGGSKFSTVIAVLLAAFAGYVFAGR